MEDYKEKYDKGTLPPTSGWGQLPPPFGRGNKRSNSIEYNRISPRSPIGGSFPPANNAGGTVRKPRGATIAHHKKLRKTDPMDPTWRRVHYVRYADDFVVGIIGGINEAKKMKLEISEFLKSKLGIELNQEKTKITHHEKPVKFLGYKIGFKEVTYKVRVKGTYRAARRRMLTLMADQEKVIKRLKEGGFCDGKGDPEPCFRYMHQTQSLTNSRVRTLILGLCNYYKLANNRRRFTHRISYILRHSIAKMYAAKYKLGTRAQVFKRGGKSLSLPLETRKPQRETVVIGGHNRDQIN